MLSIHPHWGIPHTSAVTTVVLILQGGQEVGVKVSGTLVVQADVR